MREAGIGQDTGREGLAESVQLYRVCWEAGPESTFIDQTMRKIGELRQ